MFIVRLVCQKNNLATEWAAQNHPNLALFSNHFYVSSNNILICEKNLKIKVTGIESDIDWKVIINSHTVKQYNTLPFKL